MFQFTFPLLAKYIWLEKVEKHILLLQNWGGCRKLSYSSWQMKGRTRVKSAEYLDPVWCVKPDTRENYSSSTCFQSHFWKTYTPQEPSAPHYPHYNKAQSTSVWAAVFMCSQNGFCVWGWVDVCVYRQYLAVCVCRMQRVSRKPFDMPQQIIQIPAKLQLYLLLPSTLFSLSPCLSFSLSFFPLASEITPSCFTQCNALHTTLVCVWVYLFFIFFRIPVPHAVFSCGDNCHSALMLQAMCKKPFPLVVSAAGLEWWGQICCPVSFTPESFATLSHSQTHLVTAHKACVCFAGYGETVMPYSCVWPSISVLLCCLAHKIYSFVDPLNMIISCTDKTEVSQREDTLSG